MAEINNPDPVKYFTAILYKDCESLEKARKALSGKWGMIEY